MLISQGYAGLSMDRLAEATEYSKGTVYQHFSTKEDLVMALASQTMEQRVSLFERVAGSGAYLANGCRRSGWPTRSSPGSILTRSAPS